MRLRNLMVNLGGGRFMANLSALALAQVAIRISRVVTILVLTRALSPADFGSAAIVLTVYELLALFTRNGIAAKVVQADDTEVAQVAQTAYWLTWIVCAGLLVIQAVIAIPVSLAFHDMRLALPIASMGLIYLATPLCNIQSALMQREGRLGRMALAGGLQVVTDNVLSALLALGGMGLWAIVLPKLLVAPIWVVMNRTGHTWRSSGRPTFVGWRAIARFSRTILGVELLGTLQANVDTLLVGYVLGVEALGIYYFAFNAGLGITLGLVGSFASAVFPHLCAARGDRAQLAKRFRTCFRTLGLVVVPLVLCQAALAPIYVPILFGAVWKPAIPVLMIICLSALPRPFACATSQLLRAVGRPEIDLRWQAWLTVVLVAALVVGLQAGILGVAVAVMLTQWVVGGLFSWRAPAPFVSGRSAGLAIGPAAAEGRAAGLRIFGFPRRTAPQWR